MNTTRESITNLVSRFIKQEIAPAITRDGPITAIHDSALALNIESLAQVMRWQGAQPDTLIVSPRAAAILDPETAAKYSVHVTRQPNRHERRAQRVKQ